MARGLGILIIAAVASVGLTVVQPPRADAVTGADFNPGNIISDTNFYNPAAMTQPQIQSFLNSTVGTCENGKCLNVLRADTTSRPASGNCAAYQGAAREAISTIIYKVQVACKISAKVILVTLQKETSLLTARAPSDGTLRKAMGYACPDTAACDSTYYGIFNQLYGAAWQLAWYGDPRGSFTYLRVGAVSNIRYSPIASCGSAPVVIQNRATAALYYYTPYQPNRAALANLGGLGDSCSAYGNRNFWVFYNRYFGSPTMGADPRGDLNEARGGPGVALVRGWAFDPETRDPIKVDVYVDGRWTATLTANVPRPDVRAAYPNQGANHGFSSNVPVSPGARNICVYAINYGFGTNKLIECAQVNVSSPVRPPVGDVNALDVTPERTSIAFRGWAVDPDVPTTPVDVQVVVNGVVRATVRADDARPDVGTAYPAYGPNHGYQGTVELPPGTYTTCIVVKDSPNGTTSTTLGCKKLALFALNAAPIGTLAPAVREGAFASLSGWTIDPDTSAPISVDITVNDRVVTRVLADQTRADIGNAYPNYGAKHGYSTRVGLTVGDNRICGIARNVSGGADRVLGCRTVTVPPSNANPIGDVNEISSAAGGVFVRGWAIDPDTTGPILVDVWVDGRWAKTLTANAARADVAAVYPRYGAAHGFTGTISTPIGRKTVCVYGIDTGGGANTLLGCRTVG